MFQNAAMRSPRISEYSVMHECWRTRRSFSSSGSPAKIAFPSMKAFSFVRLSSSSVFSSTTRCWCGCSSIVVCLSWLRERPAPNGEQGGAANGRQRLTRKVTFVPPVAGLRRSDYKNARCQSSGIRSVCHADRAAVARLR